MTLIIKATIFRAIEPARENCLKVLQYLFPLFLRVGACAAFRWGRGLFEELERVWEECYQNRAGYEVPLRGTSLLAMQPGWSSAESLSERTYLRQIEPDPHRIEQVGAGDAVAERNKGAFQFPFTHQIREVLNLVEKSVLKTTLIGFHELAVPIKQFAFFRLIEIVHDNPAFAARDAGVRRGIACHAAGQGRERTAVESQGQCGEIIDPCFASVADSLRLNGVFGKDPSRELDDVHADIIKCTAGQSRIKQPVFRPERRVEAEGSLHQPHITDPPVPHPFAGFLKSRQGRTG